MHPIVEGDMDKRQGDDLDAARSILAALAITALLLTGGLALYGAFKAWLA